MSFSIWVPAERNPRESHWYGHPFGPKEARGSAEQILNHRFGPGFRCTSECLWRHPGRFVPVTLAFHLLCISLHLLW